MERRSFGLTPNDKDIYLEATFNLMYYSGFSYTECMKLPLWQRRWFIDRINKEIVDRQTSRSSDNQTKAMEGRNISPTRLQRFT